MLMVIGLQACGNDGTKEASKAPSIEPNGVELFPGNIVPLLAQSELTDEE